MQVHKHHAPRHVAAFLGLCYSPTAGSPAGCTVGRLVRIPSPANTTRDLERSPDLERHGHVDLDTLKWNWLGHANQILHRNAWGPTVVPPGAPLHSRPEWTVRMSRALIGSVRPSSPCGPVSAKTKPLFPPVWLGAGRRATQRGTKCSDNPTTHENVRTTAPPGPLRESLKSSSVRRTPYSRRTPTPRPPPCAARPCPTHDLRRGGRAATRSSPTERAAHAPE